MVLSSILDHTRREEFLYLYEVEGDRTIELPFSEYLDYWSAQYHFSRDETKLVVFIMSMIHGINTMNVFV